MTINIFPDPILSANIYASGLLDEVLRKAVAPFWKHVRNSAFHDDAFLWTVRYSRNGEHLKIRIHGSDDECAALAGIVSEYFEEYLNSIRKLPAATSRNGRLDVPPIDLEDQLLELAPDRSLVWTNYQRSPVSLAGAPWLEDDMFAAVSCKCLGCGCELVLDSLEMESFGSTSGKQKLLIKALLSGLAALGWHEAQQAGIYLEYHRDWLLRFFIEDEAQRAGMLAQFTAQVDRTASSINSLRQLAHAYKEPAGNTMTWAEAVKELGSFLDQFQGSARYLIDPFTKNVSFSPIFKIFHGLANQIGLHPIHEAYVHHLLLVALAPKTTQLSAVKSADKGIS
jgi:hypothetical protein